MQGPFASTSPREGQLIDRLLRGREARCARHDADGDVQARGWEIPVLDPPHTVGWIDAVLPGKQVGTQPREILPSVWLAIIATRPAPPPRLGQDGAHLAHGRKLLGRV